MGMAERIGWLAVVTVLVGALLLFVAGVSSLVVYLMSLVT